MCGTTSPTNPISPADGDGGRRGQGRRADEQQLRGLHRNAEGGGLLLPKLHRIHDAATEHHDTGTEDHHRCDETHLLPACHVEAAEEPGVDDQQLVTADVHQIRGCRARRRADGNTGEQERGGWHTATDTSEQVDHRDGDDCSHEGERLHGAAAREIRRDGQNEREHGAETGAGRDAQQIGIRQGIAKDALIRGPGDRQSGSDKPGQDDARQANLEQDGLGT